MDMELKYLMTFYVVNKEGGVLRAANKFHLTQPAVTYHIKMLEQSLGVMLYERSGKRLFLTTKGKLLQDFCEKFFSEWDIIRESLKKGDVVYTDEIRISSVSTFGRYVLFPLLLNQLPSEYRFKLSYREGDEIVADLLNNTCDIGIVANIKPSNLLLYDLIYKEEFVLIAAKAFKCRPCDLKKIDYYNTARFITYDEGDFVFSRWFEIFFGICPKLLKTNWHVEEIEEVIDIVSRNKGLSIVPQHALKIKNKSISILYPFKNKKALNNIYMAHRNSSYVTRANKDVRENIIKILQNTNYW